jgi:hypothetical protein
LSVYFIVENLILPRKVIRDLRWARIEAVGYAVKRADKNPEFRSQNSEKGIRLWLSRKI